ncbi:MAG TPA: hypothetical protein VLF21_02375 [Candidatus Saccharimonadales bacterium]|nr:hypothetical protein [Candidatus Saccharimonadales bacterium]
MPKAVKKPTKAEAKPAEHRHQGWMPGITLVLIGFIFLAQNYTNFKLANWWALFLLIPAASVWHQAYKYYKIDNYVGRRTWGAFMSGLFLITIVVIFLDELDWGRIWPLFLVLAGLSAAGPRGKH